MGKKKKLSKQQKKANRLQKAKQWLTTYSGSPKNITRNYRRRFHLDTLTAVRDLQEIGVKFTPEYLDAVKRSEEERIRQKHLEKERRQQEEHDLLYENSDDVFAFIVGYTSGGAPYGTTWAELGLEPYASYEELMDAYARLDGLTDEPEDTEFPNPDDLL